MRDVGGWALQMGGQGLYRGVLPAVAGGSCDCRAGNMIYFLLAAAVC